MKRFFARDDNLAPTEVRHYSLNGLVLRVGFHAPTDTITELALLDLADEYDREDAEATANEPMLYAGARAAASATAHAHMRQGGGA